MRIKYIYPLVFALLTSISTGAHAAPAVEPEVDKAPMTFEASAKSEVGKLDLNKADVSTLQKELSGVGEVKAQAIVAYRDINGPFSSVDELLEVKGIGKSIIDKNRDRLHVE